MTSRGTSGLSDEQAADALQEAMLRLWRELRRGTSIERPLAWLYRTCTDSRWSNIGGAIGFRCCFPDSRRSARTTQGRRARTDLTVWAAVDGLPPRQRHVLYLHYVADLTFEQIAVVVGISRERDPHPCQPRHRDAA